MEKRRGNNRYKRERGEEKGEGQKRGRTEIEIEERARRERDKIEKRGRELKRRTCLRWKGSGRREFWDEN
eukprot:161521-Amorphochlora_amoeboformis.AAC.1